MLDRNSSIECRESSSSCIGYVGPARNFTEMCQAFHIAYTSYRAEGYTPYTPSALRCSILDLLPDSLTLVGYVDDTIRATTGGVLNSKGGLPSSASFDSAFSTLSEQGRIVCEGTRLASDPNYAATPKSLASLLLTHLMCWAHAIGAHDFVVVVNPKHKRYWQEVYGFESLDQVEHCSHVQNHPGHLLRIRIPEIFNRMQPASHGMERLVLRRRVPAESLIPHYTLTDQERLLVLLAHPTMIDSAPPSAFQYLLTLFPASILRVHQFHRLTQAERLPPLQLRPEMISLVQFLLQVGALLEPRANQAGITLEMHLSDAHELICAVDFGLLATIVFSLFDHLLAQTHVAQALTIECEPTNDDLFRLSLYRQVDRYMALPITELLMTNRVLSHLSVLCHILGGKLIRLSHKRFGFTLLLPIVRADTRWKFAQMPERISRSEEKITRLGNF